MRPTDPLYALQWHFDLIGDIETIWEDYDGTGVTVGVYDDGIDYKHTDLDGNYDESLQVEDGVGNSLDGFPALFEPFGDGHGTSVAGLIAAEANNGKGGVGVAHGAAIGAVNIFDPSQYGYVNGELEPFLDVVNQGTTFDIVSNSWGSFPDYYSGLNDGGFADLLDKTYERLSRDGRGGLGTMITQAAGNDDMDANGYGVNASRFTITVAATDEQGNAAWYSNFGASILVAAPAASVTTDLRGDAGYNLGNYTSEFGGTSAATPVTSGVIALMLDANPDLGWRDVQNILAASASLTGSDFGAVTPGTEEEETWQSTGGTTWNGGGYHIHANYGYGMINAYGAVRMAEVWHLFSAAQTSANELSVRGAKNFADVTVPDRNAEGVVRKVTVKGDILIEHVQLTLKFDSDQVMDLQVRMTSPDGTTVTVAFSDTVAFNPYDAIDGSWTFGIDGLRGESSAGVWRVEVVDNRGKGKVTVLESAEITVYGSSGSTDNVYHFTDEYLTLQAYQGERGTISDRNGGADWLNFAAVTSSMRIDLKALTFGTHGKVWGELSGTFENLVTGDGNDKLIGNGAGGEFHGMRGNDVLLGEKGNDRLFGGQGGDSLYGGDGKDQLYGGQGNDKLLGGNGKDSLDGGSGKDQLRGERGNDTYHYSSGATVIEKADAGYDRVLSAESVKLSKNVEKLVLQGNADIGGTGNSSDNYIQGNAGDNTLKGGGGSDRLIGGGGDDSMIGAAGNDTLNGGNGSDILTGGGGADVFEFSVALSAGNVDEIRDFEVGTDRIHLDSGVFAGLNAGKLPGSAFSANAAATAGDASDRVIYESDTGDLWFDPDGTGSAAAIRFATLSPGLALQASDFLVF